MKNIVGIDSEKLESLPSHTRMSRKNRGYFHYYRDYPYNKVRRFLTSRVGRKWDDVFSEYTKLEWLDSGCRTEKEVRRLVTLDTFMKDGKVWYYENRRVYNRPERVEHVNNEFPIEDSLGWRDTYYVHPETRVLCKLVKGKKFRYTANLVPKAKDKEYVKILGDYHQLVKINGVWHEVIGKPVEENIIEIDGLHYKKVKHFTVESRRFYFGIGTKTTIVPDYFPTTEYDNNFKIVNGEVYIPYKEGRWYYRQLGPRECMIDLDKDKHWSNRRNYESVKIITQRQVSKKELRKHGLKNDDVRPLNTKACEKCGSYEPCWHSRAASSNNFA